MAVKSCKGAYIRAARMVCELADFRTASLAEKPVVDVCTPALRWVQDDREGAAANGGTR